VKAVGQFTQGIASLDAGKYTRKVMRVNSRNALNAGVTEQEQIRHNARLAMGQQMVAQGDSGFQVNTGSALDALRESATARELDISLSRQKADLAAQGFKQQGDMAYAQGYSGMVGGMISGAASIGEEVAKAYTGGAG
jgi:hypothetical protein